MAIIQNHKAREPDNFCRVFEYFISKAQDWGKCMRKNWYSFRCLRTDQLNLSKMTSEVTEVILKLCNSRTWFEDTKIKQWKKFLKGSNNK